MNDVILDWRHWRRSVARSPWLVQRRILFRAYWESLMLSIFQWLMAMPSSTTHRQYGN